MKTCSVCQRCYEDDAAACVENHGILIADRLSTPEAITNYRLDSLLERDAAGESYLATHIALDQPFTVRIIAQKLIADAGDAVRQTLEHETQAAAALDHPNITRVYESGTLNSSEFYIVTELIGGQTLQEHLREVGSLSEAEAVTIARQTANALTAAHDAGIIHRAVSPANMVLIRDDQDKILVKLQNFDFGGIRQQTVVGDSHDRIPIETLRYLSPEQYEGKSVDALTDVYSLGIVLYEMLCGRSPFVAPTSTAIFNRQINEQPLAQLRFEVRALLTHTIKESLQKRPAARLHTDNFVRQLQHIAQILLPFGKNLPETTQISSSQKAAAPQILADTLASESAQSANEEQSSLPQEIITLNEIDSAATEQTNEFVGQSTEEKIGENAAGEMSYLNESAANPVIKDETGVDLFTSEPIRVYNKNADSLGSEPIFVQRKQVEEIPLTPDGEQSGEDVAAKIYQIGEPIPIFVQKKQFDAIPFESEPIIVRKKTVAAPSTEPEVFFSPNADIKVARKAESAAPNFINYSDENRPPRRVLPTNRAALLGVALLALLISVVLGAFFYNRRQQPTVSETAAAPPPASSAPQTSAAVSDKNNDAAKSNDTAETTQPDVLKTKSSAPINAEKTPLTAKQNDQKLPTAAAKQTEPLEAQTAREKPLPTADGKPRAELSNALNEFISATNSRNIERQMDYYAPTLNAYYQTRNTSQGAVRAEKKRVFARADAVDIQTGKPDITLSPDGQKATMRFRKKYAIKQGPQNRSGEVVQELQWVKSDNGWRIVSERDVKVINR